MIGMMKGRALVLEAGLCQRHLGHASLLVLEAGLCQRHLGHASLFANLINKYINGLLYWKHDSIIEEVDT